MLHCWGRQSGHIPQRDCREGMDPVLTLSPEDEAFAEEVALIRAKLKEWGDDCPRVPYLSEDNWEICEYDEGFAKWLWKRRPEYDHLLLRMYVKIPSCVASSIRDRHYACIHRLFREYRREIGRPLPGPR